MIAVLGQVSDSTVDAMIRVWRIARLSSGIEALGYPRENILIKALKGRSGRPPPLPDTKLSDPEIVQKIVYCMTPEVKTVFEAYHLKLIRGSRCRNLPHKVRATILGISERTYRSRRKEGYEFVRKRLAEYLD